MVITRPVVTDDDGSGTGGTVMNAAFFNQLLDYIDARVHEAVAARDAAVAAQADARGILDAAMPDVRRAMRLQGLEGLP